MAEPGIDEIDVDGVDILLLRVEVVTTPLWVAVVLDVVVVVVVVLEDGDEEDTPSVTTLHLPVMSWYSRVVIIYRGFSGTGEIVAGFTTVDRVRFPALPLLELPLGNATNSSLIWLAVVELVGSLPLAVGDGEVLV